MGSWINKGAEHLNSLLMFYILNASFNTQKFITSLAFSYSNTTARIFKEGIIIKLLSSQILSLKDLKKLIFKKKDILNILPYVIAGS